VNTIELHPEVLKIETGDSEFAVMQDAVADLANSLKDISESDLLDELHIRGQATREALPEYAYSLDKIAQHKSAKVVILSLPEETTEGLPLTPIRYLEPGEHNLFMPDLYRGLLAGIANWYGYGYTSQQHGVIHNNIIPIEKFTDTAGHSGSAKRELGLHVEDASYNGDNGLNISPDFLTLHYFRNPAAVPTLVSFPDWEVVSSKTRKMLSEKWFFNKTNPAQGGARNDPSKPVSVLYGPNESDPWLRINTAKLNIDNYTTEQAAALSEIKAHLETRRINLALRAGEIAIIDNRRVLHGRPTYTKEQYPKYDGTDRWLRRLTVTNDSSRLKGYEIAPRVVDPAKFLIALAQGQA
jgi:L-asparagine oxygenase